MARWSELLNQFWTQLRSMFAGSASEELPNRGQVFLISVLAAILLWFTLKMRERYVVALNLPTEVVQIPAGQALVEPPPDTVRVQLEGQGWQLLQLYYQDPVVPLDATKEDIDVQEVVRLSTDLPSTITVAAVRPQRLGLEVAEQVTRTVRIESRVTVTPAPMYELIEPPRLDPDTVQVTGAAPLVEKVQEWPTQELSREGVQSALELQVPLAQQYVRLVEPQRQYTTLQVRAALFTEGIRQVPVRVTDIPQGGSRVRLDPAEITIQFRLPMSEYSKSQEADGFSATVPYARIINDTTGTVVPDVQVPSSLHIRDVRVEPDKLEYFTVIPSE